MIACFLLSMSDSPIEVALVDAEDVDEESENQLDFFLLLEAAEEAAGVAVPLVEDSLCRCWSRIWSSPIAK